MSDNTSKTLKNSAISVIATIVIMVFSFINRKVFVMFLDVEYLGYNSLFTDIFTILSVAELGIGNVISFHLYKEIVNNNTDEIGKLMCIYKWLYRIVAAIVLVLGVALSFALPLFVRDATSSWSYLYLIYYMQLASVVFGYFLSYKRTIYIANQKEYKCVKIDLFVNIAVQILQLVMLALFHNYLIYLALQLSITLISNFIISNKVKKDYPFLSAKYSVSKTDIEKRNMFSDIRNYLVHQISYAIYGGTDNIIISSFCGIRTVGLYGNYVLIQKGVMQVLFYKLLNPVQATIGNIIYSDRKKEDLWNQFKMLDMFSFFFATYIGLGFLIFYQPVIDLWLGKEYLLDNSFVLISSLYIYLGAVWEIVYKYRTVFGDYKQDRNCMILSAILNIALSIPGAIYMGVTGVIVGTAIAFLPIAFGRIRFVVKNYFEQSMFKYYIKHFAFLLVFCLDSAICLCIVHYFGLDVSVIGLVIRFVLWLFVPFIINNLVCFNSNSYKYMIRYFKSIIKKVVKRGK